MPPDSTLTTAVTLWSFGSLIVSALTTPPADTLSVPPLPTDAPLAVPPEDTFIVPPLPTERGSSVPPEDTVIVPPFVTVVPDAVPPLLTNAVPPLTVIPTARPLAAGSEAYELHSARKH